MMLQTLYLQLNKDKFVNSGPRNLYLDVLNECLKFLKGLSL